MISKPDGYVTAKYVAAKLGKNVSTIYRWLDSGQITGMRVGKLRYVKIESLIGYLGPDAAKAFSFV